MEINGEFLILARAAGFGEVSRLWDKFALMSPDRVGLLQWRMNFPEWK
jgi:hypothetical protein